MHRSGFLLPCDLCDAKLATRTLFDEHMKNAHGTTSLKPMIVAKQVRALIDAMPRFQDESLPRKLTVAEAEAAYQEVERRNQARDRTERTCRHCDEVYPTVDALVEHRRDVREDYTDSVLRSQFKSGWLTFRAGPQEANDIVTTPWDMGVVKIHYVFHADGSWVQFQNDRMRNRYIEELQSYLDQDSDLLDIRDRHEIEKFIGYAKGAKSWDGSSFRGGRHRG